MKLLPGNPIATSRFALLVVLSLHRTCGCVVVAADDSPPVPVPIASDASYADAVEAHMGYVTEHALDEYGPIQTPMWLATIDIQTSRLPDHAVARKSEGDQRAVPLPSSNLYLDQPTIVAAYELARRTGCKCYSDAASVYTGAFLNASKQSSDGDFSLQASRHYEVIGEKLVTHQVKHGRWSIYTPAWETVWHQDPEATEQAIRSMALELIEARQAKTPRPDLAFPDLAQRAIVLDSLCWLASKKNEPQGELYQMARQVTAETSTSGKSMGEIGIWVESLIRASRHTGEVAFQDQAAQILSDHLQQSVDSATGRYVIARPVVPNHAQPGATINQEASPQYASVFDSRRETASQQPMPLAEACLSLWEVTGQEVYRQAAIQWAETIRASMPANAGHGARAEDYGRAIHFLVRTSEALQQSQCRTISPLNSPTTRWFISTKGDSGCSAAVRAKIAAMRSTAPAFCYLRLYLDGPDPTAQSALHF